jgi:hypothetical protein
MTPGWTDVGDNHLRIKALANRFGINPGLFF